MLLLGARHLNDVTLPNKDLVTRDFKVANSLPFWFVIGEFWEHLLQSW